MGDARSGTSRPPYPGATVPLYPGSFPLHSSNLSYYGIATIQVRPVPDILPLSFLPTTENDRPSESKAPPIQYPTFTTPHRFGRAPESPFTITDDPFDRQFVSTHLTECSLVEATDSSAIDGFPYSKERKQEHAVYIYIYMGIKIGNSHKLPPSSALPAQCLPPKSYHHRNRRSFR